MNVKFTDLLKLIIFLALFCSGLLALAIGIFDVDKLFLFIGCLLIAGAFLFKSLTDFKFSDFR